MRLKPLALLGALLLAGCNDEPMTLAFQKSVGSSVRVDTRKQELIDNVLVTLQIDPQSLRWWADLEDGGLVHMSELQPLSDAQRTALRGVFEEIVQARAASTLGIEVTLDISAQARQALSDEQRQQLDALPQPLMIELALAPEVLTMALIPQVDETDNVMVEVDSAVKCELQARPVEPFPAGVTMLWKASGDKTDQLSVEIGKSSYPARYRFRDARLQEQVQSGELRLQAYLDSPLIITLGFADLGQHRLYSKFPLQHRASTLIRQCDTAANALPRPLSFYVGDGLDRLESVTYKGAPQ